MIDWTQMQTADQIAAKTDAARRAEVSAAIDAHVDAVARERGYASAAQLASYSSSTVREWAYEAQGFVVWRDAVWLAAIPLIDAGGGCDSVLAALQAVPAP